MYKVETILAWDLVNEGFNLEEVSDRRLFYSACETASDDLDGGL
jgi:hypothetical protein